MCGISIDCLWSTLGVHRKNTERAIKCLAKNNASIEKLQSFFTAEKSVQLIMPMRTQMRKQVRKYRIADLLTD